MLFWFVYFEGVTEALAGVTVGAYVVAEEGDDTALDVVTVWYI